MKILLINGPNMNLLGMRQPEIYGKQTYKDLLVLCETHCRELGAECICFQSNHEGAIVDVIQQAAKDKVDGIVINAAAYAHTSIAIADALAAVAIPTVNVHISEPKEREIFRHIDYIETVAEKTISGKGLSGYTEAIDHLAEKLKG